MIYMRYSVKVVPNAKKPEVIVIDAQNIKVKVDAKAEGGRANARLIEILSEHFSVPKSSIVIVHGATSRTKVVEINFISNSSHRTAQKRPSVE